MLVDLEHDADQENPEDLELGDKLHHVEPRRSEGARNQVERQEERREHALHDAAAAGDADEARQCELADELCASLPLSESAQTENYVWRVCVCALCV